MEGTANTTSVSTEYQEWVANQVLRGLSFFFPVPKKSEVELLKELSLNGKEIVGDINVQLICDVMEQAMTPLKSMFVKGGVITAALFFTGRVLSILPFIPAICYLFGTATLLVTRDLYLATQQMKYALTHFINMAKDGTERTSAQKVALRIDDNARQSICDMLFFGRDDSAQRFLGYASQQLQENKETVDPLMVTRIFFPLLNSIEKLRGRVTPKLR
jgi:hypothetical protein